MIREDLPDVGDLVVGIVGGTGKQGSGLAFRFMLAGQAVLVGSRTAERGIAAANQLAALPGVRGSAEGGTNATVAARADLVVVTVPWAGHAATVAELEAPLAGKVVVDCVNPVGFDDRGPYALTVPEGSAAEQAAQLLPQSEVCAAFHHLAASTLANPDAPPIDSDIMVVGDHPDAVATVQALANLVEGARGIHAGPLRNARHVEALTTNLITINKRYKTHAGIRITGL